MSIFKRNNIEQLEIKITRLQEQIKYFDNMPQTQRVLFERKQYENELVETQIELVNLRSDTLGIRDRGMKIKRFYNMVLSLSLHLSILLIGILNASLDILGKYGENPLIKTVLILLPSLTIAVRMYENRKEKL